MRNAARFRGGLNGGPPMVGTCMTSSDATLTEALGGVLDFVWLDTEHAAIDPAAVQHHVMAANLAATPILVRTPSGSPDWIKPVLDAGADGIVVPLVRGADDVRRAVSACRYPPTGARGFGPRRANGYGGYDGDFLGQADRQVLAVAQIEQIEAVDGIDAITRVEGLDSILIGANDLSGSMGLPGQPRHPDVLAAIDRVVAAAQSAGIPFGAALGEDLETARWWRGRGARWICLGTEYTLMRTRARALREGVRDD